MLAKVVAGMILVLAGLISPVSADPWHGHQGRQRRQRSRRRYWDRGRSEWRYDYNPLPGFIGGILGGFFGSQINKDRDDREGYRDDVPRN